MAHLTLEKIQLCLSMLDNVKDKHIEEIIKAALEQAEKIAKGELVVIDKDLVRFLNGEDTYYGLWWGETDKYEHRFPYWWRKYLPKLPQPPRED